MLIILGHDMTFTIPLNGYGVMSYFYTFHIQGFFLLPFLYGIGKGNYTAHKLGTTVIRLYWPYFILSTLLLLINGCLSGLDRINFATVARLYLLCDSVTLRQVCGLQILWFLPAMLSLVLLKELYYRNNRVVKVALLVISAVCILLSIWSNSSYYAYEQWHRIYAMFPLGLMYALQMLPLGIVLRWSIALIDKHNLHKAALTISILAFAVGTAVYGKYVALSIGTRHINIINAVLQTVMPIIFCVLLVSALRVIRRRLKLFTSIGRQSMYIYIISPFVGYACYFTCLHFNIVVWWIGLIAFPVIAAISYFVATVGLRGRVKLLLFPRNTTDLATSFCRRITTK